ncbi:Cdc25 phosphatase Ibp1 [Elasticomyces elasticus]|nr:Cdc25 phosphatase Ibp1 [Elasticomyces elasticus]
MSSATIVSLPRISREELAKLVRDKEPGISIIDVRDSDYIGGHIVGCQNVPTSTHDYRMPELVRTLADKDTVVFHCALSQQRGPSSALRYLRERERMSAKGEATSGEQGKDAAKEQKVVVLDGGFTKWQEVYGTDAELTEGYVKDLWDDSW